jgi:type I restriction enzyme S subunit
VSWPLVKLGKLCTVVRGSSPRPKGDPKYYGGVIPRLMVSDVTRDGKYVTPQIDFLTEAGAEKSRPMKKGDFIIAVSGQPGQALLLAVDACIHDGFAGLRNLDESQINKDYLFHFMNSVKEKFSATASGAIFKNLTTEQIRELEIPLPSLDEQKRIAEILDKANAIRLKRQQAIQLADDFLRSVFVDMFGDPISNPMGFEEETIGNLCDDLFLGLTSKVDYVDDGSGFPLVRAKDINTGELKFDVIKHISETQHKKLTKNHLTKKGDLLVSKSGTLGTCAIVKTDKQFSTYESIFTVRPNPKKLNTLFLINLIQNNSFQQKLIGKKVGGTVAHLNLKMFRDLPFALPPIDLQNKFADKIEVIDKKVLKYRHSSALKNELFSSLSQKAFAGEL